MSEGKALPATGRFRQRFFAASCRSVLIFIGVLSVSWSVITYPVFWRDARLDYTADRILDGEQFKREILQTLLAKADSAEIAWARSEALRSAAIVRLQLAEQASIVEPASAG